MRRSICELCIADHANDSAFLRRWLANKTVENFLLWLNEPENSVLVAEEDGALAAVGSVTDTGFIGLNYVSPNFRFRGVSRALVRALEARVLERGNRRCIVQSTETAHPFYHALGYRDDGMPQAFGTGKSYPMARDLFVARACA